MEQPQNTEAPASGLSDSNAGLGQVDVLHNLKRFARSPGYFEIEWVEDAIAEIARLRDEKLAANRFMKKWAHERKMLKDEIAALRNLATCDCGDEFTGTDKGRCMKCISTVTAAYSVKIYELEEKLGNGVIESRDSVQIGQTGSAQAKPENSDMDSVCHDIAPSPNAEIRGGEAVPLD